MAECKNKLINQIIDKSSKKGNRGYGMTRHSLSKKSVHELKRIKSYL